MSSQTRQSRRQLRLPDLRPWFLAAAGVFLFGSQPVRTAPCPPGSLGTSRVIEVGTNGALELGLKSYPQTLALEEREIVLTFDDGPSAATTAAILDALAAECVKATFFLIGRNAEGLPALVRREIREGHTVGHHSYSHPAETLRGLSLHGAKEDILRGIRAVERAGFGAPSWPPRVPFFRFPGFADTPALLDWLASESIAVFGTDVWASDWVTMTPEAEQDLILKRLDEAGRGIVLFHDTKEQTAAMLPVFLRELKARGYKIAHIVPGAERPQLRQAPPGWFSETEKIITQVLARARRAVKPGGGGQKPAPAGGMGQAPAGDQK